MKPSRRVKTVNVADILPVDWQSCFSPEHPRIGLGLDIATTTKDKSNPSSLSVCQQVALSYYMRLVLRWKTADPAVTKAILRTILTGLPHGLRARRLCIDATSERFFAAQLRREFAGLVPVELVVASETIEHMGESMTMKSYLGNLFTNTIEDGYLALPPCEWIKTDIRLVSRDRGSFVAAIAEDGGHGDVWDGGKLALHALMSKSGRADAHGAPTGTLGVNRGAVRAGVRNPWAKKFQKRGGIIRPI
ncbi:hypothetical protein [Geminisphaera colitermitum]|uniref:hypothetical protein n=1 Tax=Geminisphaera colitermitum TaxID=1148786 RepID=UPI000158CA8A|nr:hypothetical protein [Geminisphaera colitermitum]